MSYDTFTADELDKRAEQYRKVYFDYLDDARKAPEDSDTQRYAAEMAERQLGISIGLETAARFLRGEQVWR